MAPPLRAPLLLTDQGELPGDTAPRSSDLRPTGAPEAGRRAGDPPGGGRRPRRRPAHGVDPRRRPVHARRRRRRVPRAGRAALQPQRRRRARRRPGLRDARRRLGGEVRRPDPVRLAPLAPRPDTRARCERTASRGSTCSGRARPSHASVETRARQARHGHADHRRQPADDGDRLRALRRRRLRLGRSSTPATASCSPTPTGRWTPAASRRSRRAGPTARCCSSPTTASCRESLREYLQRHPPGYSSDPVRGVYNRAWIVGRADAISSAAQDEIDSLLEITAVSRSTDSTVSEAENPAAQREAQRQRRGRARADGAPRRRISRCRSATASRG